MNSCVDEVNIGNDKTAPNKLVVQSIVCPDSIVTVNFAKINNISESYQWLNDVSSYFSVKSSSVSSTFLRDGRYFNTIQFHENDSLKLTFIHPILSGTLAIKIPSKISINKVDTFTTLQSGNGRTKAYRVYFKDSAYNQNYYRLYVLRTYKKYSLNAQLRPIDSSVITEKLGITGTEIPYLRNPYNTYNPKELLFADEIFNGVNARFEVYEILPRENNLFHKTISVKLVLENITKGLYDYYNSRNAHLWQQNSITQIPTVVSGNIENGYGIFGAYTQSAVKVE